MGKTEKYEVFFIKSSLLILSLALVHNVLMLVYDKNTKTSDILLSTVYFIIVTGLQYVKYQGVSKGLLKNERTYIMDRIAGLVIILFGTVFIGFDSWGYAALLFPILLTSLTKGKKLSLILVAASFIINTVFILIKYSYSPHLGVNLINFPVHISILIYLCFYIIFVLFAILCSKIYEDNLQREHENSRLLSELEGKYDLLAIAQEEAYYNFDRIKEANTRLEDANKKLNISLSEFYTLQQISQAISSIFNMKELLKFVNDIILGVMGVNNSTIILLDEDRKRLKVETTNITDREELKILNRNVNTHVLMNVLESGKSLTENFVDKDQCPFAKDREISSVMCVPLSTKAKKYGVVLIEHKYYNAFNEDDMRLLEIIGQQVGIALENAQLYQKMQEMAVRDGFTGVYNKQYFQELLEREFKNARENNYSLSLAIMDADHFKKFNDTFGHLFGDKVLKSIVDYVRDSLRSRDILARFGGEEFIILFPGTRLKEACEKVDMLRKKIAVHNIEDNLVSASVTVSFGVSSYPETSSTAIELIRHADNALYTAKDTGRNRVVAAELRPEK